MFTCAIADNNRDNRGNREKPVVEAAAEDAKNTM